MLYLVYFCTLRQHALWLVALAAAICLTTAAAGFLTLRRSGGAHHGRRVSIAGATIGLGVWSTHFVAMLGYIPGNAMAYRVAPTLGSLGLSATCVMLATRLADRHRSLAGSLGAALLAGGGIAAMHYLGTSALEAPVRLVFDPVMVAASVVLAIVPLVPAIFLAQRRAAVWPSCLLLTLAVTSLHFTGMAAIRLLPQRLAPDGALILSAHAMSVLVGLAGCAVLGVCLSAISTERRIRQAVHGSERDFGILVKGISDCALYLLSPEGTVASWNAGAARLKGYAEHEALGQPLAAFYTPEDRAAGLPGQALATALHDGKFTGEGWRMRKDGSTFWAHVTIERVHDASGAMAGFAKITRDMTRWKESQDRIAETKAQRDTALDNMHQGLLLFDRNRRLVLRNQRLLELWSVPAAAVAEGSTVADVVDALTQGPRFEARPGALKALVQAISTPGTEPHEIACHDEFVVAVISRALADGGWVTTFEDVTERHRSEARIAHLALHDSLTGLPNRSHFGAWCGKEIGLAAERNQRFALVAIGLDRFKQVNDARGHQVGDRVLIEIAGRLAECCGIGAMAARLGGDEFAAGLTFDSDPQLAHFMARLVDCFARPCDEGAMPVEVSASFGIATFPQDADEGGMLLANADLAMHRAKASAQEHICYYQSEMDELARTRRQIAAELRGATERGEFQVLYQPQHVVRTGELVGYEALLRWHHPVRGLVSPMDFIPIAEETGEIVGIGEWVLREAAMQAATWPDPLKVAVNLSPVQLLQDDLVPRIMAILLETGLPPSRLELEITESAIIADKGRALHLLRQIKAMGIAIAMDDFGTGYSSLDTLHSFPFDKIKIDKSFLQQSASSPPAAAIVKAVLALGRNLRIPVLAEGVETPDQVAFLIAEGCDEAQGYLFGRPHALPRESGQSSARA